MFVAFRYFIFLFFNIFFTMFVLVGGVLVERFGFVLFCTFGNSLDFLEPDAVNAAVNAGVLQDGPLFAVGTGIQVGDRFHGSGGVDVATARGYDHVV